jgi:arylsulfatase A-like enzyme
MALSRRDFLRYSLAAGAAAVAGQSAIAQQASPRPNILLILADDLRFDAIGALGHPHVLTPHLDALVARGTTFTRCAYMGSLNPAVCIASRAMLLTGRPLFALPAAAPDQISRITGIPTFPQLLRGSGYTTAHIGKWQNGTDNINPAFSEVPLISIMGMGRAATGPASHRATGDFLQADLQTHDPTGQYPPSRAIPSDTDATERFTDSAVAYLLSRPPNAQPFSLTVALPAPHDPHLPPPPFDGLYRPADLTLPPAFLPQPAFDNGELQTRDEQLIPAPRTPEAMQSLLAGYYASVSHVDHCIGRLLAALEQSGQAANTLIIVTSDNGLSLGAHGLLGKQSVYNEALRVPLILAGPGIAQNRRNAALCYLHDLFPTILDIAGVPAPAESAAANPLPLTPDAPARPYLFHAYRDLMRSVTTAEWKLNTYTQTDRQELFHLTTDPHETTDLSSSPQHAETLARMQSLLRQAQEQAQDPLLARK